MLSASLQGLTVSVHDGRFSAISLLKASLLVHDVLIFPLGRFQGWQRARQLKRLPLLIPYAL